MSIIFQILIKKQRILRVKREPNGAVDKMGKEL